MRTCITCAWFDEDDEGDGYICTVNPPDYKGMYVKTYPEYHCKQWEPSSTDFETKDDFMRIRNDVR